MRKRFFAESFPTIVLDATASLPLYKQLYEGLRGAVLTGQLKAGTRLPSTRALASELLIARGTVQFVFEQLKAEGYLRGSAGSGTYVSSAFPPEGVAAPAGVASSSPPESTGREISRRGKAWVSAPYFPPPLLSGQGVQRAFRVGLPDVEAFPHRTWHQLLVRSWRQMQRDSLGYHHAGGYFPLREAIAGYLATSRGVRCTAEQVIIVTGSQQGMDLAARVLLDPGEEVWIEDPGYLGARGAFLGAGARVIPVPLDEEGLVVQAGSERAPHARLAFVTPSHQFPLGMTMSLTRRLNLLEWARRAQAWVLEDDYDSEFRYTGRPLAALQGVDSANRVMYLGTFSKVLFPALRLGYLVVPPDLVKAFIAAHLFTDMHPPLLEQIALAAFLHEGYFARHIRRMRQLYRERQAALLDLAKQRLAGRLELHPSDAGMHLVGWLSHGQDDRLVAQAAARVSVDVSPLSLYRMEESEQAGILLGYTAVGTPAMEAGVERLASVLTIVREIP